MGGWSTGSHAAGEVLRWVYVSMARRYMFVCARHCVGSISPKNQEGVQGVAMMTRDCFFAASLSWQSELARITAAPSRPQRLSPGRGVRVCWVRGAALARRADETYWYYIYARVCAVFFFSVFRPCALCPDLSKDRVDRSRTTAAGAHIFLVRIQLQSLWRESR